MPETHFPLPLPDAAFMATLGAFLGDGEDAARYTDQFQPFVVTGGLHGVAAGLTAAPDALIAYCAGEYVTETGAITYPDEGEIWVVADEDTDGHKLTFTRVPGTHYLIDTTSVEEPATPVGAVPLMLVTTSGGAITGVRDMRARSAVRTLANRGMVFSSNYDSLQDAINALPPAGGIVYIEPGEYLLTQTLEIGDGAAAAVSTRQGIYLMGLGAPYSAEFGFTDEPAVKLVWAGPSDPVVEVKGPLAGWGIQNLTIDGSDAADYGIHVISGQYGDVRNVAIRGCLIAALGTTTVTTFGAAPNASTFHNKFTNVYVDAPGSYGIELTSGAPLSNTSYNTFENVFVVVSGNGRGLQLGACANNVFTNLHFSLGEGAATAINFAYDNGQAASWPASNQFFALEPHDMPLTQTGSPAADMGPNLIVGISQTAGALPPDVDGLAAIYADGDGNIVLAGAQNPANPNASGGISAPGGVLVHVREVTVASDDVTADDSVLLVDASGAAILALQLPSAVGLSGKMFVFKKIDATANTVRVLLDGAETIDGVGTQMDITTQWTTRTIVSDGTDWFRLDRP